jgi:hypothetical protein
MRLLIDAVPQTPELHKTVSTERAQHTEIPLPWDKEPLRFGSTRAKLARGNMVSTLRGKATNIASRGSCAQSIPGLTDLTRCNTGKDDDFIFMACSHSVYKGHETVILN